MPRGVSSTPTGNADGRAAFALGMRKLAVVEALPIYAELCAAADARHQAEAARVLAGNGRTTEAVAS